MVSTMATDQDLTNEEATQAFGERLAALLEPGDVILLEGELGAGKTFLVRVMARALGVPDDVPVTSPTFALVHELPGRMPILHADLYRLDDPDELVELGLMPRLGRDVLAFVEWGERFVDALGPATLTVRLQVTGEHSRRARITAGDARGEHITRQVLGRA
jgi:tRNA threonylcarbamoyladenosine biosynthesis protein TsaE